ncbi:MAG: flagellar hook assembly protein FlgD [Acetobacteraceae bacterium]
MSIASVAAQQGVTATSAATAGASQTGASALDSLTSNFNNFLTMLMTQLKNQDPTSPLDTNQFTSELVQFSSVEQQIKTNTSLTRLIELTQSGEVMQASSMIGKQVTMEADHMPLQNGKGEVQITAASSGPALVTIYSDAGRKLQEVTLSLQKGVNRWIWDGKDASGAQIPDGAYKVAVMGIGANGQATALPFAVVGTATGVDAGKDTVQLRMGGMSVDFGAVRSVGG